MRSSVKLDVFLRKCLVPCMEAFRHKQKKKHRESTTARLSQAVRNKITLANFSFWGQIHLCCLVSFFVSLLCARWAGSRLNILDLQLPCIIRVAPSSGSLWFTDAWDNPWLTFSPPSRCCPVWVYTHPQLSPSVNKLSWSVFNCIQDIRIRKNRRHLKDVDRMEKHPKRKYLIFPLQFVSISHMEKYTSCHICSIVMERPKTFECFLCHWSHQDKFWCVTENTLSNPLLRSGACPWPYLRHIEGIFVSSHLFCWFWPTDLTSQLYLSLIPSVWASLKTTRWFFALVTAADLLACLTQVLQDCVPYRQVHSQPGWHPWLFFPHIAASSCSSQNQVAASLHYRCQGLHFKSGEKVLRDTKSHQRAYSLLKSPVVAMLVKVSHQKHL